VLASIVWKGIWLLNGVLVNWREMKVFISDFRAVAEHRPPSPSSPPAYDV
jgi:hypothetical protein